MRVLVTGGAGFIGSHTVEELISRGHEVSVLDDLSTGKLENLDLKQIRFYDGSILDDEMVEDAVSSADAVIHLAALVSVQGSIDDPRESFSRNVDGFLRVLKTASNRKCPMVYASSAAVYGDQGRLPIQESSKLSPMSPYGADKAANDLYARVYSEIYGMNVLGFRYFNVYGSRQDPSSPYSGVITKFIDRGTRGEPITIYGDGLQTRSFINVKNIAQYNVRAIEMLSEKRMEWASINLGHPKTTSICDLAEMINSSLKTSVQIVHLDKISGDIRHSTPDLHLNRKIFGYVDLISLRDGIEKLVEKSQ